MKRHDLKTIPADLLEHLPDAVVISDTEGRILFLNRRANDLFGYTGEELIGRPVETLVPDRFRRTHVAHRARYHSDPRTRPMGACLDLVGLRKDGTEFQVEISLSSMRMEETAVVTAVVRDVTNRKRVEEEIRTLNQELERRVEERTRALQEETELLQRYLEVVGVMIVVLNADQKVLLINKRGCEILGYTEAEIVGKNWFNHFLPNGMREPTREAFLKLMAGEVKPVEYFQNPVLTKSGEERTIAWHNTVLRDENGIIYATLSSGEDITERLTLERQVRQAEKLAAIGQLASGLAHEIGTPLNVIAGRAEYMLRKMPTGDPLRENLEPIIHQIERITRIVSRLLSFTRTAPLEKRPIRVGAMLSALLAFFEHQMDQHRIGGSLDCPETIPEILADPDQIQQVCFNVVHNAIQAMPQGGRLAVQVRRTVPRKRREDPVGDQFIRIAFEDTGVGIPSEHLPKVFDPFFTTKEVGQGTGLGLAVSYGIVRNHGGWMDVKSEVGRGSVFNVYLPIRLRTERDDS
jgi:PAS domain S-box-containing protein